MWRFTAALYICGVDWRFFLFHASGSRLAESSCSSARPVSAASQQLSRFTMSAVSRRSSMGVSDAGEWLDCSECLELISGSADSGAVSCLYNNKLTINKLYWVNADTFCIACLSLRSDCYIIRGKTSRKVTMACSLPLYFPTWLFVCKPGSSSAAGVFNLICNNLACRRKQNTDQVLSKTFSACEFPLR